MKTTVNERITQIISQFGYKSKRSFAEKIGIAQTSLNDILRGAEPKYSTLYKILEAEPLVPSEWLLRGEGEMLKSQPTSDSLCQFHGSARTEEWTQADHCLLRFHRLG